MRVWIVYIIGGDNIHLDKLAIELHRAKNKATLKDCAISEEAKRELEPYMQMWIIEPLDKVLRLIDAEKRRRARLNKK